MITPEIYIGLDEVSKMRARLYNVNKHKAAAEAIKIITCQYYGISINDVASKSRKRIFALPRQIAIYFISTKTKLFQREIGDMFGGRNHSTIKYSIDMLPTLADTDKKLKQDVENIANKIEQYLSPQII